MADIKKCSIKFLSASPNDTDALRFLWMKSRDEVFSNYKILVHIFVEVDSPYCVIGH